MADDPDLDKVIREMASASMWVLESMKPMIEMLEGYKKELSRHGYTEEQQVQMATDLHYMITHSLGNQANNG